MLVVHNFFFFGLRVRPTSKYFRPPPLAVAMALEEVEVPIPTEKLSMDPNLDGGRRGGVVLVATRSFNLPTYMHKHV